MVTSQWQVAYIKIDIIASRHNLKVLPLFQIIASGAGYWYAAVAAQAAKKQNPFW